MFQILDMDAIALAELAARDSAPFPIPNREPKCPVCTKLLRRITVDQTLIDIELCDEHGTWFYRHGFQAVARVLQKAPPSFDNFPPPMRFNPTDYERPRTGFVSVGSVDGGGGWGFDFGGFGDGGGGHGGHGGGCDGGGGSCDGGGV